MSKKPSKKSKKQRKPNIPPLTLLRPRLDELLGEETFTEQDSQATKTQLDETVSGLKPSDFLPVLMRAYHGAVEQVQQRLDDIVPQWMKERGYVDVLLQLVEQRKVYYEGRSTAFIWLERAGIDPAVLEELQQQKFFYRAYNFSDGSQGTISVFGYTDNRRQKVRGISFLIDYNPPWEGSVKDIAILAVTSPEEAAQRFVEFWEERGMPLTSLSESQAKAEILTCLEVNRREGIRLPKDLIRARDFFVEHILTLPDTQETPSFTIQDFDALSRTGETPESISHLEHTVGRRVRLEDGTEVLVGGALEDDLE